MDKIAFLWREAVKSNYGIHCYINECANTYSDIHHFLTRGAHPTLKYEVKNGVPLCKKHHDQIHGNKRKELEEKIIKKRGEKWLSDLYKISNQNKMPLDKKIEKYLRTFYN